MKHPEIKKLILAEFQRYTDAYDSSDTKIKLKIDHTYRVADLCEQLAQSIHLSEKDTLLAWACGMLHDIGRFEQIRQYGTFFDSLSVNHAEFGADLLFQDNLYEQIIPVDSDSLFEENKKLIEQAIRVHNRLSTPDTLTEREQIFADLLRDADKIDILRVNYETPIEEIYNTTIEDFRRSIVSPNVKKAFMERRCVNRAEKSTAIDNLVGHICLVFELVYPKSLELVQKQGYLYKLMSFQSEHPETAEWFQFMRNYFESVY